MLRSMHRFYRFSYTNDLVVVVQICAHRQGRVNVGDAYRLGRGDPFVLSKNEHLALARHRFQRRHARNAPEPHREWRNYIEIMQMWIHSSTTQHIFHWQYRSAFQRDRAARHRKWMMYDHDMQRFQNDSFEVGWERACDFQNIRIPQSEMFEALQRVEANNLGIIPARECYVESAKTRKPLENVGMNALVMDIGRDLMDDEQFQRIGTNAFERARRHAAVQYFERCERHVASPFQASRPKRASRGR